MTNILNKFYYQNTKPNNKGKELIYLLELTECSCKERKWIVLNNRAIFISTIDLSNIPIGIELSKIDNKTTITKVKECCLETINNLRKK